MRVYSDLRHSKCFRLAMLFHQVLADYRMWSEWHRKIFLCSLIGSDSSWFSKMVAEDINSFYSDAEVMSNLLKTWIVDPRCKIKIFDL